MAITIGSVEVDVVPNTQGVYATLKAALEAAGAKAGADAGKKAGEAFGPAMQGAIGEIGLSIGEQIGAQIANRIKDAVKDALREGITIGGQQAKVAAGRQGENAGGAFARTLRAKLTEAFRAMPKLDISLADTGVDAELARLRARLETLSGKRIGIDVDVAAADAEVADISDRLQRLGALHPNVSVRADTAAARAALDEIREEIARVSAQRGTIRLETDGSFGIRLRAAVQAAQAALPNINIGADASQAQAQLASLRAQLGLLSDQRVGIDIDAATASARIDDIRTRLRLLGATTADIAVRVDAATAEAQLAQVEALADAVDGKNINLHVSNAQALGAIFQVSIAIAALAAVPAVPVLAAGAGSLVASFTAAGVGVGAFAAAALPAISSIKGALDAQKQAQDAAATATAKGGQSAAQAASQALQLAGAQQALATAERNGARQIAQAQQQVVQARRAVGDAVQQAAQQQQAADRAVVQADRQVQQSARAVVQAEDDLAQAQKDAKQAQLDLVAARKTAAEQLLDLNNQLKDSQFAARDAALQVQEAQLALNQTLKDPKATQLQRAEAQLAYEQAVQQLSEQRTETKRLQDQTAAANNAGVEGSATYTQAQQAVADAQKNVADTTQAAAAAQQSLKDAQQGVADAQQAQAQTEVQNARSIADAQAKVGDAVRGVADAQAAAADSIASAQRSIQSASLSAAGGVDASATAAQKYQQALAKLTPSARGTFNAFVRLRTAFKNWSKELQPDIMPIFTRGINGVKNSLPGLTPIVTGAASGIGTLQDKISRGFKSPWWQTLKRDFQTSVGPAIVGVGTAIGNVFVGTAGVVDAFLPHIDGIAGRMDRITGRFANFGKNLRGSPEFENFLSYSSREAPKLADALGKIGGAFLDVAQATAPLSGPVLKTLGSIAAVIGSIATSTPGAIQLMYLLFVGMKLFALATKAAAAATVIYQAGVILATLLTQGWTAAILAADAAFEANPIVAVITIIIAALALLVVGILYAWNHWGWFRDAVLGVWHAIQTAALWAWNNVLKPTFDAIAKASTWLYRNAILPAFNGIVTAYQTVAAWAIWLWRTVLAPVFTVLGVLIGIWWKINKIYFTAWWLIIKMVAAIALWLWHQVMDPVFKALMTQVKFWWAVVKLYFTLVMAIFKLLGSTAWWVWTHALRPAFQAIGDMGRWLWSHALQPAFNAMKAGIEAVGKSFVSAKDLISTQWSRVSDLAKKPVSFLINTVYNKGIIAIWNKVADIVSGPHLKPVKVKGFSSGGVAEGVRPGYTPGRDTHLIAVGGGEAIMRPEWTRAVGAGYVDTMNAAARRGGVGAIRQAAAGVSGYDIGGVVDTITGGAKKVGGAIKSGVGTGIDWAKTGIDLLANPGKVWDKLISPVKDLISKAGSSKWAKLLEKMPIAAISSLKEKVLDLVGLGGGGGGKIPSGQHAAIITQALAAAHVPPPGTMAQWLTGMNTLISRESGWNASAINNWDSNAKAGHPSQGLTQTIPGTWAHYVPSSLKSRGILDPVGNVAASIRYIVSRYGNITGVQQANANMPPQGYDSGGYLQPGLNLAYNGTGRPEPVFTSQQASALTKAPAAPALGGGEFTGSLYLDSGELLGLVRGEVRQGMTDLTTTLRAGRKG